MKKRNILIPVAALGIIAPSFLALSINKPEYKAEAYKINSLTTTIDLNDTSASDIRSYYTNVNGLRGDNLLIKLKEVLSNGQKYYSYDSNTAIWQMYEIIDRDWVKSPASAISGYNPSTNIITGYTYGTNASHPNDPYVHALYVNRDVDNQTTAWGSHKQTDTWGINQEHIWPKSHGFDTKGSDSSGGARGDPMHLWAGNGYANNIHSNDYYGYVDTSKSYTDCGSKAGFSNVSHNLSGISRTVGSGTVFEPQDSDKGDIARAVFYMVARYNNISGTDNNIDGNNPNLTLDNNINLNTGTSEKNKPFSLGVLSDLLEWNKLDPVDDFEIHRNNLLYNNYTNNRNPFIDFPEWVDIIWGEDKTSTANPASDPINGAGKLTISSTNLKIAPGYTNAITATTTDNSDITWTVTDETVATLSKATSASKEAITINALKEGSTTITATATIDESEIKVTCNLTVGYPSKEEALVTPTDKVEFIAGSDSKFKVTTPDNSAVTYEIEDTSIAAVSKASANSGEEVTIKGLKAGTTNLKIKGTVYGQAYERIIPITISEDKTFKLDTKTIIIIAVAAVVVIAIIIIILVVSKKARKKAKQLVKKQVKKQVKKSTSSSSKSTSKKKK
ncbi:MAG: endonuclease [Bacilli bacterium]|nr:endonuclease [Bacilli bacterium]